jgi:hypothetical protein
VGLVVRSARHRATALLIEVYGKLAQQAQQVVKKADIPLFRSAREDVFIQMSMDLEYWKVRWRIIAFGRGDRLKFSFPLCFPDVARRRCMCSRLL